jgi:hypothetical protein
VAGVEVLFLLLLAVLFLAVSLLAGALEATVEAGALLAVEAGYGLNKPYQNRVKIISKFHKLFLTLGAICVV